MSTDAELLRRALDALDDPLSIQRVVRDHTGRVVDFRYVFANQASERLLGIRAAEVVGESVGDAVAGFRDSDLFATFVRVATDRHSAVHEISWPHATRGRVVYEVQVLPLDDSIVACARDMTLRTDLIEQRAAAEAEQQQTAARLAVVSERDRIANELHQTLVRQLFDVVVRLHTAAELGDTDTRTRLAEVIDMVDDAINQTRAVVFAARANGEEPAQPSDVTE